MADAKLSDNERLMIAARVDNGETRTELAKEYGVAFSTIRKAIEKVQAGKVPTPGAPPVSINDFRKRAHKLLWRANSGKEKVQYDKWQALVEELKKDGKMSAHQAIIQASKSFDVLKPLFATCDVNALDPYPGSHTDIVHYGKDADRPTIKCLNKVLSNRENLAWAIEAAGEERSPEGDPPAETPNWTAYYMYLQALTDPSAFTGKYLSTIGKVDGEEGDENMRKSGRRSISELNEMLETLNQKPEGEEE